MNPHDYLWITHPLVFIAGICVTLIGCTFYKKYSLSVEKKKEKLKGPPGNGNLKRIRVLSDELTIKEQALLVANAKFEALFKNAPVCINSFTGTGQVDLWNNECVKVLGYTKEDLNRYNDIMEVFYGKDSSKVWGNINKADGKVREYTLITKAGKKVRMTWANIALPDGTVISVGHKMSSNKKSSPNQSIKGRRNVNKRTK